MANYRPIEPFNVPMFLFNPTYKTVKGSTKKIYPEQGILFFCSFRTFGGTEKVSNNLLTVEDTATIETWYRPDISSDSIIADESGKRYEILGTPENINKRSQVLKFKVRAIKGGA